MQSVPALAFLFLQTVQVPVEPPRLSEAPLAYVGAFGPNRLLIERQSWEASDIPGLVRGTVIIVTPGDAAPPLQVMEAWIDCRRRVYQLSPGRAYDHGGVEFAQTSYLPDQPVGTQGPVKELADRVCVTPLELHAFETVTSWRDALEQTRFAAAEGTNE
jgi:hypothetical protein